MKLHRGSKLFLFILIKDNVKIIINCSFIMDCLKLIKIVCVLINKAGIIINCLIIMDCLKLIKIVVCNIKNYEQF